MVKRLKTYKARIKKYNLHLMAETEYLAAAKRIQTTEPQLNIHQAEIKRLEDLIQLCILICDDIKEFEEEVKQE
ncbi:MAG: hypothetical protein V7785_05240 [Bermanella sp.]